MNGTKLTIEFKGENRAATQVVFYAGISAISVNITSSEFKVTSSEFIETYGQRTLCSYTPPSGQTVEDNIASYKLESIKD
jgi:hypothetical protein